MVKAAIKSVISDVTDVSTVQGSNSEGVSVTDVITAEIKDVTPQASSRIPKEQERPRYVVFDDLYEEGGKKYRSGVWYFAMKTERGRNKPMPTEQWICSPLHVDAINHSHKF